MSTILVAAILIALTVIPAVLFIRSAKRKEEKHRQRAFALLKNHGNDHGLSFSHELMLKESMLALDLRNNKMLWLHTAGESRSEVFDLENIKSCTLFNLYDSVRVYETKAAKTEQVLSKLGLKIEFAGDLHPLQICFYDRQLNGIYEIDELEAKAAAWKDLVSGKAHPVSKLRRA